MPRPGHGIRAARKSLKMLRIASVPDRSFGHLRNDSAAPHGLQQPSSGGQGLRSPSRGQSLLGGASAEGQGPAGGGRGSADHGPGLGASESALSRLSPSASEVRASPMEIAQARAPVELPSIPLQVFA